MLGVVLEVVDEEVGLLVIIGHTELVVLEESGNADVLVLEARLEEAAQLFLLGDGWPIDECEVGQERGLRGLEDLLDTA